MNLKETVQLPQTDLPMRANLREAEPARLAKWEQIGLEEKIRAKSAGKPKYVLHDGPPYANGDIHLGHAINKVLKDIVVRHRTMAGYDALYVPGWDCHGLPIEQKALHKLGDRVRVASPLEIRKTCQEVASHWIDVQRSQFKRLLVGGDWEHPYKTMAPEFEVGILEAFRAIVERGLVYRALRPVYWDATYRTALAEAEIEYKTVVDPSIYVSMPLVDADLQKNALPEGTAFVIWTTTPWTLVGNVAVALGADIEYCLVKAAPPAGSKLASAHYIVAADLAREFAEAVGLRDWSVEATGLRAKQFEGASCHHPLLNKTSLVVLGDHVTVEKTGVVHTANGHGVEDFHVCQKYGIEVVQPLDDGGAYIRGYFPPEQMTDAMRELEGVLVQPSNPKEGASAKVMEIMRRTPGLLLHAGTIEHEYPHSWRSHKQILFRATEQWFMSVDADGLRDRCLELIDNAVEWIPSWGKNRIRAMMEGRPDWCLSRQRAWGVPIPAFRSKKTGQAILDPRFVSRFQEWVAKEGTDAWFSRSVEELLPEGYVGPDGETAADFEKTYDVLDVWFDSGSSHIAVCEGNDGLAWPADLYLEGSDQHRGWFQTSLLVAAGARNAAPYKAVLTHGFVLDQKGIAMSKSLGNVISPLDVVDKYGADILRLWVASEDYRSDIKSSMNRYDQLTETYRRIRNSLRYLCGNLVGYDPAADAVAVGDMPELERFALHRLRATIKDALQAYDHCEFHRVAQIVANYCSVDLGAFYFDVLKDRLYCDSLSSPRRRAARTVLFEIAQAIVRLMAPIAPHTADEVWERLPNAEGLESVHLADLPTAREEWRDEAVAARWTKLLALREAALKPIEDARKKREEPETEEKFIGNSLDAKVAFHLADPELAALAAGVGAEALAELLIVSEVELSANAIASPRVRQSEEHPGVHVLVTKAPGAKCERCWRALAAPNEAPALCPRCAEVVRKDFATA